MKLKPVGTDFAVDPAEEKVLEKIFI